MDEDHEEVACGNLDVWKQELGSKAEALVLEAFPRKGRYVDELMNSQFSMDRLPEIMAGSINSDTLRQHSNLTSSCSTSAEKVGDSDNRDENSMLCNKMLVEMNNLLMRLLHEMCEDSGILMRWLGFLIPRMQGGNNFGVSVQLKTLKEVTSVRKSASVALQLLSRYYNIRGESIKKLLKHPQIEDYLFLIQSIDRRHFFTIRVIMTTLRNNYFGLHDHFLKNIDLIRNPRSDNTHSGYCSYPRQLFINFALLIMESCKIFKTEKIPEIYCPSSIGLVKSTKASSTHSCNLNNVQCPKVEQLRVKLINLWNKTASAEIGVILQFDECFQCKRSKSILLEKWKIQFLTTRNERQLLEQFLIHAVHLYLHFSQQSSSLFQYNVNPHPFSVHYKTDGNDCSNGEQLCTDFKYNNQSFLVCETGNDSSMKKVEAETLCRDAKLSNLRRVCLKMSPFQGTDLCLLGKNLSEVFNSSILDDPALKRCEQCSNVKNNSHSVTINKQSTAVQGDSVKLAYNTGHRNSRINAAATNDANLHCHVTRSFQQKRRKTSADKSHHCRSEKPGKVSSSSIRPVKASSPVRFHSITKLPLTSSPAPVNRFQKSFQFDPSSTTDSVTMKKCSSNCRDCESTSGDSEDGSIPLKRRIFSKRMNNLLGSFEVRTQDKHLLVNESALQGRFTPFGILNGFTIELGASGTFLPPHVRLPVTTIFLDSPPDAPLPYIGRCNLKQLGKKGYHIPKAGNVQVILFNPQGSVVNMFIVQYNLKEMKCRSKTFVRQRTYFMPKSATYKDAKNNRSWLRYLIHLRFASSSSGKLYLHSDIKMLFARKPELDCNNVSLTSAGIRDCTTYELRAFNEIPQHPTMKCTRKMLIE
ncbi:Uncharacterized protein T07_4841 [Trichinella nelsoni]|uniref:Atos-like conserved domain-containing protein n=1 Tax=Trichinella nelsoni TaxID=6336 RepID=A0A0V0S3K9_9BILA|nr:Uncharacterized protein T07_4841 [Trichinella nelsoni]